VVDLTTMNVCPVVSPCEWSVHDVAAAVRDDGRVAAMVHETQLTTIELGSLAAPQVRQVQLRDELGHARRWSSPCAALHPAAPLLAMSTGDRGVIVIETETGRVIQHHDAEADEGVVFSPDGRWLVVCGYHETHAFGSDGEQHAFPATHVAFSSDGKMIALAWKDRSGLDVRPFDRWPSAPPRSLWPIAPPEYVQDRGDVQLVRFSPDGRRLGVFFMAGMPEWTERARSLAVIDVSSHAIIDHVRSPVQPPYGFNSISAFGFDHTGDRVLARTHHYRSRHRREPGAAAWMYSIAQRRHLGWLATEACEPVVPSISPDSEGSTLVGRTEAGFYGRLCGDAPLDGTAFVPPFEAPALARQLLLGAPLDLDPKSRDGLDDLDERFQAFVALTGAGGLAPQASLSELVDATRGWTHLLPTILERARELAAARPQFGQRTPTVDHASVGASVAELAAMPREALETVFQRQLATVAAAADAAARGPAPTPRRMPALLGLAGIVVAVLSALLWWLAG
jgi:hypothetical protein